MTTLMQDVRYALRQLQKTPGFTITVLLTLALGIGANAAIFTLVNSVLLKSLPVADPKMLVHLGDNGHDCCVGYNSARESGNYSNFSTETYQQIKKNIPEFEELAAMQAGFTYRPIIARRDGAQTEARSVMGEFVSGNYFRTFGLNPQAGRLFVDADDTQSAPFTAVMSYETWQHEFAGDSAVIGSTFWINTKAVTIVGIAPKGFYGDRLTSTPPDYYLPIETMAVLANAPYVHDPEQNWLYMVGRVKPGVELGPLQQKVNAVLRQAFAAQHEFSTEGNKKALPRVHTTLTPGGAGIQTLREDYESHLHLLMWIAGLVLLIACANIANLLLVRGMGRKTEMSVRTALGAGRARIIRQLLTESILLATMGGVIGLIVAYAGTHMLLMLAFPGAQNVPIEASPSLEVIGFAFGISLLTGVLFGVAPAWISAQAKPADALRSGSRSTTTGASLLQRVLVVLQAALSLVLLVSAGLFAQNLNKLQSMDLKLDSKNRYMIHINPQAAGYSQTQLEALYRTMEERFHAVPGIVKVGISNYTPMEDNNWSNGIGVQGHPETHGQASFIKANADYFDSVGTRVLMGRGIGVQDTSTPPHVTVVNQAFVKEFFKGQNPIGQRIGYPHSPGDFEVVGVVEDTAYTDVRWKDHSMFFVPIMQRYASEKRPDRERHVALRRDDSDPDRAAHERYGNHRAPDTSSHQSQPHRSEVPDLRRTDRRPLHRGAHDRPPHLTLRRPRPAPRNHRPLRRHRLHRSPQNPRDRHPHGPRRRTHASNQHDHARGSHPNLARPSHRNPRSHALCPLRKNPALRNHQRQPHRYARRSRHPRSSSLHSRHHPRPPSSHHRPRKSPQNGITLFRSLPAPAPAP